MTDYEKAITLLKNNLTEEEKAKIYKIESFMVTKVDEYFNLVFSLHQDNFLGFIERELQGVEKEECADLSLQRMARATELMFKEIRSSLMQGAKSMIFEETFDVGYTMGFSKAITKMEDKND